MTTRTPTITQFRRTSRRTLFALAALAALNLAAAPTVFAQAAPAPATAGGDPPSRVARLDYMAGAASANSVRREVRRNWVIVGVRVVMFVLLLAGPRALAISPAALAGHGAPASLQRPMQGTVSAVPVSMRTDLLRLMHLM